MALVILDAATAAAVAATTDREANIAALVAPWEGGNVTARILAGTTLLATLTQGPWVVGPTSATLGTRQARTFVATGTPTRVVFRAGSTDIFELSAGVGSGDVSFADGITSAALERLDGLVVHARSSLPDLLPSWVPAAGEVTTLTVANGRLANSFISQCAPNFDTFYFPKTVNAYSGGIVNPWFGEHGAVFTWGGGHSATNDNTVTGLAIGDVCTWFRAVNPSPYFGTGTDATTRGNNSNGNANAVLDWATGTCTIDGKPVSPHSYGTIDVRAPADGGAANGSMEIVIIPAMNRSNDGSAASAHRIPFNTASTTANAHAWQRVGTDFIQLANPETGQANAEGVQWAANCWTQFVPAQNRTYIETNNNHAPRWFDWSTETYEQGTGTQRDRGPDNPDSGIMFHVPSRDLMVHIERRLGVLRISTMAVGAANSNPSWSPVHPTLSASIAVPANWTEACWCEDNDRIIVGNVSGVNNGVREIEIPATLTDTWTVTPRPFGAGQTITWPVDSYSYKRWAYNARAKCIVYVPEVSTAGTDTVYAYRPVGV